MKGLRKSSGLALTGRSRARAMTDVGVDKCPSARGFNRAESNNPLAAPPMKGHRLGGTPEPGRAVTARATSDGPAFSSSGAGGFSGSAATFSCGGNLPLTNTAGGCSPSRHVLREPKFVRHGPLHECEQFMCVNPSDGYRLRGVRLYSRHDRDRRRDRDLRGHCRQHHQTLAHLLGPRRSRPSDRGALLGRGSEGPARRIPGELEGTSPRSPSTLPERPGERLGGHPARPENDPGGAGPAIVAHFPGETRKRPRRSRPRAFGAGHPEGTLLEKPGGTGAPLWGPCKTLAFGSPAFELAPEALSRAPKDPLGGSQASSKGLPRGRRGPFPSDPAATRRDPKPTLGGAGPATVALSSGEAPKDPLGGFR